MELSNRFLARYACAHCKQSLVICTAETLNSVLQTCREGGPEPVLVLARYHQSHRAGVYKVLSTLVHVAAGRFVTTIVPQVWHGGVADHCSYCH